MNNKKIMDLCRIGTRYPELMEGCRNLIYQEIMGAPMPNSVPTQPLQSSNTISRCRDLYEEEGKLAAVKYLRDGFMDNLMAAKRQVEQWADDNGWVQRKLY